MAENGKTKIPKAAIEMTKEWWNKLSIEEQTNWVKLMVHFARKYRSMKEEKEEGAKND